jgi:Predicted nucleotide kinase
MMVGLPGSGKSSIATEISTKTGAVIHASDQLRKELHRNDYCKETNQELFKILHKRIRNDLLERKSIIYDATNINSKKRKMFLHDLGKIKCRKVCILVATPYEVCLSQNTERTETVPEEVLKRMYMNWNTPYYYEGWDEIEIAGNWRSKDTIYGYVTSLDDFDQESSCHKLTLGEHLLKTHRELMKLIVGLGYGGQDSWTTSALTSAALLHDCGKPFVKTRVDTEEKNGEIYHTDNAHYYNHQYVGAYDSLFYNAMTQKEKLYRAVLIEKHMRPYDWKVSKKAREHDLNLMGEGLYGVIEMLHQADVLAH